MNNQNNVSNLKEKITSGKARVAVIGLGYVGLPLAIRAKETGYDVIGIDKYMDKDRNKSISAEGIAISTDYLPVKDCDVILICVPTPLTDSQQPDISFVRDASEDIADNFGRGPIPKLVVLESTSFPGTTREVILSIFEEKGIRQGVEVMLAYSPERVDPGTGREYRTIPRLVGGLDDQSGEVAKEFYCRIVDSVTTVSKPEVAELAKLLENIFRAVNIALVNELSVLCRRMDINVWEVLEAAATKPFGFMPFKPGPGLGGHCIPIDPFYLAWKARKFNFYPEFIELAGKVNRSMPSYVVEWVADALNDVRKSVSGSKVLAIGAAYKENVTDTRESPALKVMEMLLDQGADLIYHDSYVPSVKINGKDLISVDLTPEVLESSECIVVLTAHDDLDIDLLASVDIPIVDTRNALGRGGI
ncbi:MAG: nucleotide sugar dehydrogenase [Actinobacteria bacterium]|nr:nucleotide sugar dehydrogenase [Actinomycetota bacterium]